MTERSGLLYSYSPSALIVPPLSRAKGTARGCFIKIYFLSLWYFLFLLKIVNNLIKMYFLLQVDIISNSEKRLQS